MRFIRSYMFATAVLALVIAVALPATGFAHGEEIKLGGAARGAVALTAAQTKALGLELEQAKLRPIADFLKVNGEVKALPDEQADVSLRISGRVDAVYVNVGDVVRKGNKLTLIQSRTVGNPPPTVVVRAPMDGVIDARNIIVGQAVEPNTTLFHLSNRTRMRVVGRVYEEDLEKVRVGQKAHVKLLAYPDKTFTGTVSLVGPTLDSDTRTVAIWIVLDNKQGLLKPNLFARADIVLHYNKAALSVPNAAILEANGEKFVFVGEGDEYRRVVVTVGASDDEYTAIDSQLVAGDEVVTQGARELYTLWLTGGKIKAED
ncbi:MAG: efflux RND transporter periplasmic adaptor subunit [Gammaproteobacteria bacterium]